MIDPLLNEIHFTQNGIGIAILETGDVKNALIQDIQKTISRPACIYESSRKKNIMYYFQYFKSTVFLCIVKKDEQEWYLADTLFNPAQELTESILLHDKLLYAK